MTGVKPKKKSKITGPCVYEPGKPMVQNNTLAPLESKDQVVINVTDLNYANPMYGRLPQNIKIPSDKKMCIDKSSEKRSSIKSSEKMSSIDKSSEKRSSVDKSSEKRSSIDKSAERRSSTDKSIDKRKHKKYKRRKRLMDRCVRISILWLVFGVFVTVILGVVICLIILYDTSSNCAFEAKCPDGFHQVGKACYWHPISTKATWMTAKQTCYERGGRLWAYNHDKEKDYVTSWAGITNSIPVWLGNGKNDGQTCANKYIENHTFLTETDCSSEKFFICEYRARYFN